VRKLLLSNSAFPSKFNASSISSPSGITKQEYIKNKIIERINNYNPKLKVSDIEYLNIKSQFPHLDFFQKYFGVIVEDSEINDSQKEFYKDEEYYVWKSADKLFVRKILIYVLMSLPKEGSRNAFIAQSFFPEAIDFMGYYASSPGFSIANHPIYYINYVDKKITASMIIKDVAGMIVVGIENIEVFHQIDQLKNVPENIKDFLVKYYKDFDLKNTLYSTADIEIDIKNKITKIKTDKLVIGELLEYKNDSTTYNFKGSEEKFYWMRIIPLIVLSVKNAYAIDYSELEDFYNLNKGNFSPKDEKMHRFLVLIQFIKKIVKGYK
jgi:hypothetical protein